MQRAAVFAIAWSSLLAASSVSVAHAQRFEGVITMHLNQARGGVGDGRGGPPNANGARGAGGRGGNAGRSAGALPQAAMAPAQNMRFNGPSDIEYMTRRGKVRVSLGGTGPNAPGAIIYVPDEGVVYTLIPSASMYLQSSIAELNAPPASVSDSGPLTRRTAIARTPVITHTKKFELIAGHRCEHIVVQVGAKKTDICMAKGMGEFIMPGLMGTNPAWTLATEATNGFPLKVIGNDGTVMMEVTKIERKALPESLFGVPESYTKMPDPRQRPPGA